MAYAVCIRQTGGKDQILLLAKAVVTADGAARGGEDLVLHAGEGGRWIDRLATAVSTRRNLLELSASEEKEKKRQQQFARHERAKPSMASQSEKCEPAHVVTGSQQEQQLWRNGSATAGCRLSVVSCHP